MRTVKVNGFERNPENHMDIKWVSGRDARYLKRFWEAIGYQVSVERVNTKRKKRFDVYIRPTT